MSFTRIKTIKGKQYRYEVTSYRDPNTGKVRQFSQYLGPVRAQELGTTAKVGDRVRVTATGQEGALTDVDDSEFVYVKLDGKRLRSLYRREELEWV